MFQTRLTGEIAQAPTEKLAAPAMVIPTWSVDFHHQSPANAGLVFSRASTAGYYNNAGTWVVAPANTLRVNHNPDNGQLLGFLSEESRTNYLLNSATPASQTVALSTGTYTLWVSGAGSCTCAAGTATGTGFGTATASTPVIFTLSVAGTVTLSVSGSLTRFQCEKGANPTSFIATAGSAATRSADVCYLTPCPFNPVEGTYIIHAEVGTPVPVCISFDTNDGATANRSYIYIKTNEQGVYTTVSSAITCNIKQTFSMPVGALCRIGVAFGPHGNTVAINGKLLGQNTLPTTGLALSGLRLGCRFFPGATNQTNAHVLRASYFSKALSTQDLQKLTL